MRFLGLLDNVVDAYRLLHVQTPHLRKPLIRVQEPVARDYSFTHTQPAKVHTPGAERETPGKYEGRKRGQIKDAGLLTVWLSMRAVTVSVTFGSSDG